MRKITTRFILPAAAAAALALGLAQAQTQAPMAAQAPAAASTQAAPQLNIRDIYDRLEAAGYRDMREIEWDNGHYEVKASNAQGQRVKLYVNASTGAVEKTRTGR